MKAHSNFTGPKSKKHLIAFSCATALASFAFIARPTFAEEVKVDNSSNLDTTAATTANVETTADLVETKVVEAPATTENVASTESTTNVSEQATTSTASSETASETASTTASESQAPAESATGQTRETVTTDRAASETATATADTNSETNVTGGQYYSDKYGYWHYKDASGKDLTGPQTIDGVKVYFNPGGVQVKGEFAWDGHYYDKNSGALVTNKFVESYGSTYYLDENGNKVIGPKEINGEWNYFDDYGEQVRNRFASDGRYYDKDGKQVDFGTNRYFQLGDYWFYAGKDGAILKGEQTIDGVKVYFYQSGVQVKGYFVRNDTDNKEHYYDKDSGALVTNNYVIAYDNYTHQNERYYVDDQGVRVKGAKTINGKQVYFTYDGRQVFDNFGDDGYFYGQDGNRVDLGTNHYVQIKGNWYYIGNDGKILTDEQTIDGAHVYFGYKGIQVKGDFDYNKQFHDKDSGNLVTNRFVTVKDKTYFIGADSKAIKGATVIDNVEYFFDKESGAQVKGDFASNDKYYDGVTGALVTNSYVQVGKNWYYVGNDGKPLKGSQTINNVPVYFDPYGGRQAKGIFGNDGYFYDKDSGAKVDLGTNRYVQVNDNWYYVNAEGKILKGDQIIDGVQVNFNPYNGIQTKGELVDSNGRVISEENYNTYEAPSKFYDKNSGALVKGQYFSHDGKWYYADAQGNILKGSQTIDGVDVYFDDDGVQAKDAVLNGYYYDKDSGAGKELPHDQFIKIGNDLYYLSSNGRTGNITIDGKDYYIEQNGRVLRGSFNIYQNPPYYDDETGEAVEKTGFVKSRGSWFYLENGKKVAGFKKIDGKLYYFSANPMNKYETNEQVRGKLARPKFYISFPSRAEDNPTYYFDAETGAAVTNQFVYADGHWYYFGKDGKALLFDQVINGQHLYFDYEGKQVKGDFVTDYKGTRYYDENSGELVTNETRTINGVTYHFDENGRAKQL
ncbi:glucosyl transferase [Streptococcus salivarius]|uniref:glucosyl transferase n=1 Tax=Streptococcus salivarius TaxID=1304 RepID=UPI0007631AE6|nr:glucosyl transferase [Streptococcus salivarius]AMB83134.1 glucosyl transferase [Streptococcus salivarius]WMS34880.1 glucosyl transferase [Streptococcus salivarius]SHM14664.1 glucan-binding repeat-containing protein [Streptococcus salivarius]VED89442.1 glucosyltransferase-I [Streptococcus salivarius]